jgi:hypothetical protein
MILARIAASMGYPSGCTIGSGDKEHTFVVPDAPSAVVSTQDLRGDVPGFADR